MNEDELQIGDLVDYVDPKNGPLHCGSGAYPHAVVVSLYPFRLISEEGDMLWSATVVKEEFKKVGDASREALLNCIDRLSRG